MPSRARRIAVVFAVAALPTVAACFYDFTYESAGSNVDGGDAADAFAPDGSSPDGQVDGSGGKDAHLSDVVPPPDAPSKACDGGCPGGFYCRYPDHACGRGLPGVCTAIPVSGCQFDQAYYCGCNGIIAKSDCEVFQKQTDLDVSGACAVDSQHYACGWEQCTRGISFCESSKAKTTYSCVDWKLMDCGAGPHDCSCAKLLCPSGGGCNDGPDASPVVFCP